MARSIFSLVPVTQPQRVNSRDPAHLMRESLYFSTELSRRVLLGHGEKGGEEPEGSPVSLLPQACTPLTKVKHLKMKNEQRALLSVAAKSDVLKSEDFT